VKAMYLLHKNRISHGDIKVSNIMFDHNQNIKLIDFGFSKIQLKVGELSNEFMGSPAYMSPEITHSIPYDGNHN
jgi:serine/threonine protein kinase